MSNSSNPRSTSGKLGWAASSSGLAGVAQHVGTPWSLYRHGIGNPILVVSLGSTVDHTILIVPCFNERFFVLATGFCASLHFCTPMFNPKVNWDLPFHDIYSHLNFGDVFFSRGPSRLSLLLVLLLVLSQGGLAGSGSAPLSPSFVGDNSLGHWEFFNGDIQFLTWSGEWSVKGWSVKVRSRVCTHFVSERCFAIHLRHACLNAKKRYPNRSTSIVELSLTKCDRFCCCKSCS